jgi:hypothetical protein
MSSEEKDVPQNTQDLTVFVQNLLQQMVRRPRPRAACRPRARRGCAAPARTQVSQPLLAGGALRSAGRLRGRRRRRPTVLGCEATPLGPDCELRARSPVASPLPLVLAATTIPRHVGRHHPAKYACALTCARTSCPLALEPVLQRKVPAVDLALE